MKHYTLLYIAWAAMCLTSCLDEHPKDQLGEDAIYGSASEIYTNAVASLYNYIGSANESEGIQGTCRGVYDYNTLTTDEAMIPIRGGDWYDGGQYREIYMHTWTSQTSVIKGAWSTASEAIGTCNANLKVVESSDFLSDEQMSLYTSEIRGIRAFWIYKMMDDWGNIPLVTDYI